jgi:hypothetical protein
MRARVPALTPIGPIGPVVLHGDVVIPVNCRPRSDDDSRRYYLMEGIKGRRMGSIVLKAIRVDAHSKDSTPTRFKMDAFSWIVCRYI